MSDIDVLALIEPDCQIDWFRPAGAGLDRHSNCVRLTHLPTGTVATSDDQRGYVANKRAALRKLNEMLIAQACYCSGYLVPCKACFYDTPLYDSVER